jgi:hypothetical protein
MPHGEPAVELRVDLRQQLVHREARDRRRLEQK